MALRRYFNSVGLNLICGLKQSSYIRKAFLCFGEKFRFSYDKMYSAWKEGHNTVLSEKSKVLNIVPFNCLKKN